MTADDGAIGEGAVDHVVGKIRSLIRDRGLTVGDTLPAEVDLAQMFGAPPSTTRDALRVLRTFGVIELRPHVGAVIVDRRNTAMFGALSIAVDSSVRSFRDIQGFRRLVEINLADELIAIATPDLMARLVTVNEAMRRANSAAEAAEIDYGFHRTLIDSVANRMLSEVYRILRPVLRRLMEAGKTKRHAVDGAYNEHARIIDALRCRNRLAYTFHMTQHLDAGLEFIPAMDNPAAGDRQRA